MARWFGGRWGVAISAIALLLAGPTAPVTYRIDDTPPVAGETPVARDRPYRDGYGYEPDGGRPDEGLQAGFRSVFPISDFSGASMLFLPRFDDGGDPVDYVVSHGIILQVLAAVAGLLRPYATYARQQVHHRATRRPADCR